MNVKPYDMQHDVIIACDFKSAEDTFEFLDLFRGEARKPFLKIGMELFYAEGPEIVREIKRWPYCRGWMWICATSMRRVPSR